MRESPEPAPEQYPMLNTWSLCAPCPMCSLPFGGPKHLGVGPQTKEALKLPAGVGLNSLSFCRAWIRQTLAEAPSLLFTSFWSWLSFTRKEKQQMVVLPRPHQGSFLNLQHPEQPVGSQLPSVPSPALQGIYQQDLNLDHFSLRG